MRKGIPLHPPTLRPLWARIAGEFSWRSVQLQPPAYQLSRTARIDAESHTETGISVPPVWNFSSYGTGLER